MNNTLDQVHYGRIGDTAPDWRKSLADNPQVDVDDDEPLAKTPEYVIGMLGFDPDEPDEGGEPAEESGLREHGTLGMKWGVRHERPRTTGGRHVKTEIRHPHFREFRDYLQQQGYQAKGKGAVTRFVGPAGEVRITRRGRWLLLKGEQQVAEGRTLDGLKAALRGEYVALPPKQIPVNGTEARTPLEGHLFSSPVANSEEIGGGVSRPELVTFADGSRAVWKRDDKESPGCRDNISDGHMSAREVGAWAVAKVVDMKDLVAPTIKRTIDGKTGTMSEFQEGKVAHCLGKADRYDGTRDLARAAVFDYITGNEDRHTGNWLMKAGRFRLIDHGLCFPDKDDYGEVGSNILRQARTVFSGEHEEGKSLLRSQAELYAQKKDKILSVLGKAGLPKRSLSGVAKRIDQLAKSGWEDLR